MRHLFVLFEGDEASCSRDVAVGRGRHHTTWRRFALRPSIQPFPTVQSFQNRRVHLLPPVHVPRGLPPPSYDGFLPHCAIVRSLERLLRRCRTGGRAVPRRSLPRTCSIRSLPFGPGPNPVAALAKGGIERKDGRVRPNQPMGGRGEREPGGTNRSAQRKD